MTLAPGEKLSRRARVWYDFTAPGMYRISTTVKRALVPEGGSAAEAAEILAYYGGDAAKARENRDSVWTGALTSNTVIVRVVQPLTPTGAVRDGGRWTKDEVPSAVPRLASSSWQPRVNPSAAKSPRELQLEEALETRIALEYELPTDLKEVIEFMNQWIKDRIGVANAIRLDPRIIAANPRQVQIVQENVKVRSALALLLTEASAEDEVANNNELESFMYRGAGVIYISNKSTLMRLKMKEKEFRFYDVRDLLGTLGIAGGASVGQGAPVAQPATTTTAQPIP
jgi:hypothetical protein